MKIKKNVSFIFISSFFISMIITGCLEHEDVPSLYVPYDETKGTKVVVSTIVPEIAESASEIAINGS